MRHSQAVATDADSDRYKFKYFDKYGLSNLTNTIWQFKQIHFYNSDKYISIPDVTLSHSQAVAMDADSDKIHLTFGQIRFIKYVKHILAI